MPRPHRSTEENANAGSRLHRRTEDKSEGKALQDEIKRVVAECFEEKQGGHVFSWQFEEVFKKSTVLSTFDPKVFTIFGKRFFLTHWTNSRASMFRGRRCFTDMAVKEMPVASPPDYSEVYVLELAQNKVYVGVSDDVERSIQEHLEGTGCDFTRMYETTAVLLPRLGNATGTINEQHRDLSEHAEVWGCQRAWVEVLERCYVAGQYQRGHGRRCGAFARLNLLNSLDRTIRNHA